MDYKNEIKKGEALFEEGKIDQAESVFKSTLQDDPDDCVSLNNLGVINNTKGDIISAEEYFKKAIFLNDDYPEAIFNLASLYQNEKRWSEASTLLEKYLDIDNNNPDIYNKLGIVCLEMEEPAKACAVLEKSLELKPEQSTVKESLDAVKKEMSEHEKSQQCLEKNSQVVPCSICRNIATDEICKEHDLSIIFCQECEVYFVHPMPSDKFLRKWYSEEEKKKRWNNDLNLAVKANHEQNRYNYEEYFRILSETCNLDGCGKVLEIGCFSGLFLKKFKDLGYECKGIDLNEGFVKYGREHYNLDLECGTVFDLNLADKSIDIIIFHQVLEHLSDPQSFLREVRRILKDDGYIFLSVPNTGSIVFKLENKFLSDFTRHRFIEIPNHLFYFSKTSLILLLKQTGFDPSAISTFSSDKTSEIFLKEMDADDESIPASRATLIRSGDNLEWNDVQTHISRAILNTIHKESYLLSKHLNDFTGLIVIANKTNLYVAHQPTHNKEIDSQSAPFTINTGVQIPTKKPKICHIGGAHSIHNLNVYLELERRGYEQFFISYPFADSILPKEVNVHSFPYRSYDDPNWLKFGLENKLKHFLSEIFKKEAPDIVHGHSLAYTCAPVWMAKKFFSIPSIVIPWSFDDLLHPTPNSFKYEKLCLDTVDMVLGTNITIKEMLVTLFDIDIKKWAHWRPGMINNIFKRDRIDIDHPTILSCRGVGPEYLQHLLLEAMPAVIKKYPNIELTMLIGQTITGREKYFDFLNNKAHELKIERNCRFIANPLSQKELALEMNRSDIVFTMYINGGNANAALEACMCGSILLHSNLKLTSDIIFKDGVNALLAGNNVSSITEKLIFALDHPELKDDYYEVNQRELFPYTNDYLTPFLCDYYDKLFK